MNEVEELRLVLVAEQDARTEQWRREGSPGLETLYDLFWNEDGTPVKHSRIKRYYWRMKSLLRDFFSGWWWRLAKSRWHRMRRGWGETDTFSLDGYLNKWMPDALRHLAKVSHGFPMTIYGADGKPANGEDDGPPPSLRMHGLSASIFGGQDAKDDDGSEACMEEWRAALEKMALGFEASEVICQYGFIGESEAEKRLVEIRDEGMALFINNYNALWD